MQAMNLQGQHWSYYRLQLVRDCQANKIATNGFAVGPVMDLIIAFSHVCCLPFNLAEMELMICAVRVPRPLRLKRHCGDDDSKLSKSDAKVCRINIPWLRQ